MLDRYYFPILKWKTGEKVALQNLTEKQKSKIAPIFEFTDYQDPNEALADLEEHFQYPVYIDTAHIDEETGKYLKTLIERSDKSDEIYPVLYFDNFPDVADELCHLTDRILVRIPVPEDIEGADYETIFNYLDSWLSEKKVSLDIMLDLGVVENKKDANLLYTELKNILNTYIKNNEAFGKIIIAVTSLPQNLSMVSSGESVFFERFDIVIFKKILQLPDFSSIKKRLYFSDYGVSKFTDSEIDFTKLRYGVMPKSKYTTAKKYWVLKGQKDHLTKTWIKNHKAIALEILRSPHYYGEDFSFGDLEIKERALGLNNKGVGSNTNWVTIDTNHHIAVVIEELSKLYGS